MGGRMLKRWLALPLKNAAKIAKRHEVVSYFLKNNSLQQIILQQIAKIGDLERLISKVATQKINPREVVQLKNSLEAIAPIKEEISSTENESLKVLGENLHSCELLRKKIGECLHEEAPVNIAKGNAIANGFSEELDELRKIAFSGKDYLDKMVERESEATGISSLKIASNNVFGYYIEVRNAHKSKVPETWVRKQTLVNAERYITEELKEYEAKILGAEEKIHVLEQEIFQKLILWINDYIKSVQQNAILIGRLDCLCSFAELAKQ
jgi:DNA mismatch repair protein MutS